MNDEIISSSNNNNNIGIDLPHSTQKSTKEQTNINMPKYNESSFSIEDNTSINIEEKQRKEFLEEISKYKEKNLDKSKTPFCFYLVSLIILFTYILQSLKLCVISDFSLSFFPIKYKYQYYRIVCSHFVHLNLVHIVIVFYLLYHKISKIERKLGTIYTLIYFNLSIYVSSSIFIIIIKLIKVVINDLFGIQDNYFDFYSSVGMLSVYFSIINLDCIVKNHPIELFYQVEIIRSYKPYYLLMIFAFICPQSSFIGNLSGILGSKLIMRISSLVIPSYNSILEIEYSMRLLTKSLIVNCNFISVSHISLENNNVTENLNIKKE